MDDISGSSWRELIGKFKEKKNTALSFLLEDSCSRSTNKRNSKDKEETIMTHDAISKLVCYSCFHILSHAYYLERVAKKIRVCREPDWGGY